MKIAIYFCLKSNLFTCLMSLWTCGSGIFRLLALSAHALDFPLSAVSYCYPFYPQHVSSYFSNAFLLKGLRIHFGIKILIIKFRNYVLPFLWPENTGFCLFVCLLFCLFSCRHFSNYPHITQSLESWLHRPGRSVFRKHAGVGENWWPLRFSQNPDSPVSSHLYPVLVWLRMAPEGSYI